MDKMKKHRQQIHSDHSGFSLIEILISIVILAIVMIPLMNNFFQAMRINQKAEKLQDYNNAASNILENMKSLNLEQTLTQYASKKIYFNEGIGSFSTDPSYAKPGIYYFNLEDIAEGDASYDAIVKVSTDPYRYEETDPSHNGTLMNNYKMPNIITLDNNLNAMFFTHMYRDTATMTLSTTDNPLISTDKSLDQLVLEYFQTVANDYADAQFRSYSALYDNYRQELVAYQNGDTDVVPVAPTRSSILPGDPQYLVYGNPDYCQLSKIQTYIDRTFDILLSDTEVSPGHVNSAASYQITYHCNWPTGLSIGVDTLTFNIDAKNYGLQVQNLYLYYEIFHQGLIAYQPDRIRITNNTTRSANFYIVKQENVVPSPSIKFFRFGSGETNIYSNMTDSQVKEYIIDAGTGAETAVDETTNQNTVNNSIISSQRTDRIFSIEVELYPHTEGAIDTKYQTEELYRLSSNIESE